MESRRSTHFFNMSCVNILHLEQVPEKDQLAIMETNTLKENI